MNIAKKKEQMKMSASFCTRAEGTLLFIINIHPKERGEKKKKEKERKRKSHDYFIL